MTDKTFLSWLLLFAIGIAGCEKSQPVNRPATAGNERPAQAVKTPSQKPSLRPVEEKTSSGTSQSAEKPPYQWPADFKLPLEIYMETPEVPKEIQGPSPPIEEEKK